MLALASKNSLNFWIFISLITCITTSLFYTGIFNSDIERRWIWLDKYLRFPVKIILPHKN